VDAEDEDFDDDGHYLNPDVVTVAEQEPTDGQIPYSAESVSLGKEVYEENCRKCHGEAYRTWARDLTKPWTWRMTEGMSGNDEQNRDETVRNIYTRLSVGMPGTPMPAHRGADEDEEDAINLEDRWHVANYTYSLRSNSSAPGARAVIEGVEVANELPRSVDDEAWLPVPATTLRLVPNIIREERLFTPLNDAISVQFPYESSITIAKSPFC
jgi:mono/diheme cytochrome c family protein